MRKNLLALLCLLLPLIYSQGQELRQVSNNPESYKTLVESDNVLLEKVGLAFQEVKSVDLLDFKSSIGSPDTRAILSSQLSYSEVLDWSQKENIQNLIVEAPEVLKLRLIYKGQEFLLDLVMSITDNIEEEPEEYMDYPEEISNNLYYQGIVEGHPESMATLTLGEESISIWLTDNNQTLEVNPLNDYNKTELAIYSPADFYEKSYIPCMTETMTGYTDIIDNQVSSGKTTGSATYKAKCLSLWMEAAYDLYKYFGSSSKTLNYMKSLFNMLNTVYSYENIPLVVKGYKVNTSKDKYGATSDSRTALLNFSKYRKNTGAAMNILFYRLSSGGRAWLRGIDKPNQYNYAVVGGVGGKNTLSYYTWTLSASEHELGHIVGSEHTHDCVWGSKRNRAIDGCGQVTGYRTGTCATATIPKTASVMSYCHLVDPKISTYRFGLEPGNRVRGVINSSAIKSTCSNTSGTCLHRFEPNDKFSDARQIYYSPGHYYYVALSYKTDVDYYKLKKSDSKSAMHFKLISPKGAYYTLQVYNSSKKLIKSVTTKSSTISFSLSGPVGYYYIKVASYKSSYSSTSCYGLRVMKTIPTDVTELEGSSLEKTKRFIIYPNPSQDKFAIASEKYKGKIDVTIYDLNGRFLLRKENMQVNENMDISELSIGNYIVNIKYEGGEDQLMLTHL